ncbi:MAG: DinB family protein [Candidatus Bathyarchaeota archaeon]|nr:DinB family protein [Candidatus Bathyarchaeota archaeon]
MSEKASILKEQLEWVFSSLNRTVEGISEEEYTFKPTKVSNSIQWNLNHLSRITNLSIPRICKGNPEYTPEGWAEDYRNKSLSLEEVMKDIEKGSKIALKKLGKLTNEQLEEEIPLWGGTRQRKTGLFAYIGELYHHRGQIAYIKGTYKRLNE